MHLGFAQLTLLTSAWLNRYKNTDFDLEDSMEPVRI